jgi:hypothetical protein
MGIAIAFIHFSSAVNDILAVFHMALSGADFFLGDAVIKLAVVRSRDGTVFAPSRWIGPDADSCFVSRHRPNVPLFSHRPESARRTGGVIPTPSENPSDRLSLLSAVAGSGLVEEEDGNPT